MEHRNQQPCLARPDLPVGDTVQLMLNLARKTGYISNDQNCNDFIHRLRIVVEAFGKALQESEACVTFREAAEFSMLARSHRRPSTIADLRSYINRMCADSNIADRSVRTITIDECRQMLYNKFGHSVHSYRKAQSILHSIFNYAIRQRWCVFNPAKAILRPPICEKRVEILTIPQIRNLLQHCSEKSDLYQMNAAIRLMLWCGIRPAEVRRLRWRDIDSSEKVVYVDPRTSKTGGARAVPLRGGALELLYRIENINSRIAPLNWNRLWRKLRLRSGLTTWQNDALRHTFASMHLKRFHNLPLLQEEMGHQNSTLLQTRYLNLRNLKQSTAKYFFSPVDWL